jgi:hypothetical protein
MRVKIATESGRSDGRNEDWAGATESVAVVLDGLTEGPETGCIHGTPWYVDQLGTRLLTCAADAGTSMQDVLADAIHAVAGLHDRTCNLNHVGSPASTVAMLRHREHTVDYLVLADSLVIIDGPAGLLVATDKSVDAAASAKRAAAMAATGDRYCGALYQLIEEQQTRRNRRGGYWVAQADPAAAAHARTGTVAQARGAALLSDGAALLVTDFRVMDWSALLAFGYERGPAALIARTREFEDSDPDRRVWPRYKHRDDATAAICLM